MAVSVGFLIAVFLFTRQNREKTSPVMSCASPPQHTDPSCHSKRRVEHACLPTVWWAAVWMIMPSQGLVSLQRAVLLPLSHSYHFDSASQVKTKSHRGTHDSYRVVFDIRLDSVTLTEPGLAVLLAFPLNTIYGDCNSLTFQVLVVRFAQKKK